MIDNLQVLDEKTLTDEQAAGVALLLASDIAKSSEILERLKIRLRDVNHGQRSTTTVKGVDLEGNDVGEVTITFPRPQATLSKDFSEARARRDLGDAFQDYFESKVVLKKDVLEILRERQIEDSLESEKLFSFITINDPTPRVGFRPNKGLK